METDNSQYFHLTLGPVQSFVGQARRTRDFWTGSFILSWLSSVAMATVRHQGGDIQFPQPDMHFLNALQGIKESTPPPQQASVPNRFKALGAKTDLTFEPALVVENINTAWQALANLIWQRDLEPYLTEPQLSLTHAIWQRQVDHFWDINWCLSNDPNESNLLDRRKNWRNQHLPNEPGMKCMMIEGLQELSGELNPRKKEVEAFWVSIRQHISHGNTDLRQGEALSALGFIKRRFVHHFSHFNQVIDVKGKALTLKGWRINPQVPSVPYMAASPWYAAALRAAKDNPSVFDALNHFLDAAEQCADYTEAATPTGEVAQATAALGWQRKVAGIDGVVFHTSQLALGGRRFEDPKAASATEQALVALQKKAQLPVPSSFYAVLLMDGDSLGSQMSDMTKQTAISLALQQFTTAAPKIVAEHSGFLIYVGGDDLLAFTPVDHAVACAAELRNYYADCFRQQNDKLKSPGHIQTSLSAAINFAHIKVPLTSILSDSHQLLDTIAKDLTGRDALAIRVHKPGGLHLQWSQPWDVLLGNEAPPSIDLLSQVTLAFARREQSSPFTNGFIFKAIDTIQRLPSSFVTDSPELLKNMLTAELVHSGLEMGGHKLSQSGVDELLDPIIILAQSQVRSDSQGQTSLTVSGEVTGDALKLIRFLVNNTMPAQMEDTQC